MAAGYRRVGRPAWTGSGAAAGSSTAIKPFIPLGTDGYGYSDTRPALRRHFEVDASHEHAGTAFDDALHTLPVALAAILIAAQVALTLGILCNALYIVHDRLQLAGRDLARAIGPAIGGVLVAKGTGTFKLVYPEQDRDS